MTLAQLGYYEDDKATFIGMKGSTITSIVCVVLQRHHERQCGLVMKR